MPTSVRLWAVVLVPIVLTGCGTDGGNSGSPPAYGQWTLDSEIAAWPAGTSWTYRVTNSGNSTSLTRTMLVRNPGLTNPIDQHPVLEMIDSAPDITDSIVLNDYYFHQDSSGTVYLEGISSSDQNGPASAIFVEAPPKLVLFPSPMQTGEIFTLPDNHAGAIVFADNGLVPEFQTVVTGTTSVSAPIGPDGAVVSVPTFVLTKNYVAPEVAADSSEGGTLITYFNPTLGMVEIQDVERSTAPFQTTPSVTTTTSLLTATSLLH